MIYSFTEVRKKLNELPIGYYAFARIPISLSEDEETSYYNPKENTVVISYPIIRQGLENAEKAHEMTEEQNESAVRAMLYHEISHAILTPKELKMTNVLNIFEDERIETVLADYYLDVNFKENARFINDWVPHKPENAMDEFYQTVRFRYNDDVTLTNQVSDIIRAYQNIDSTSKYNIRTYERDVSSLYNLIAIKYPPELRTPEMKIGSGLESDGKKLSETEKEELRAKAKEILSELPSELTSTCLKEKMAGICNSLEQINERMTNITENYINYYKRFDILCQNFNRRCSGGSAIQTYSGRINPRQVERNDYRYFERISTNYGNNQYGALNLNLFIDVSGSFWQSEEEVNTILKALEEIERKYFKIFQFNLVTCQIGERIINKNARRILTGGGNDLDDNIHEIYRKLQNPQRSNYNIVLFDGDAFTDSPRPIEKRKENFRAFNHTNTFIISDPDNKSAIETYCKNAKKVFTYDYVQDLFTNIINAMTLALS